MTDIAETKMIEQQALYSLADALFSKMEKLNQSLYIYYLLFPVTILKCYEYNNDIDKMLADREKTYNEEDIK